jgi:hypothetical protein
LMQAFGHPYAPGVDPDHYRVGRKFGPKLGCHARNQIIWSGESCSHEDTF